MTAVRISAEEYIALLKIKEAGQWLNAWDTLAFAYSDTASRLRSRHGQSLGWVHTRKHRALRRLCNLVEEYQKKYLIN